MSVYVPFEDQRKQDASFTIKAMGIQLGINVGTAIVVMIGFSLLRPRHTLVYAPKSKFATKEHQPPAIESHGWLSWVKPILRIKDEQLLSLIGCDAVLYIRFVRLLRKLLFYMSILGVGALIPIYIVATKATGDWPPASGSIEILSLAGINLQNGKTRTDGAADTTWYWAPFSATYLFSILIAYFMYRASCDYIDMRQYYFRLPQNEASMKSLMVSRVPQDMQSDDKLKQWVSRERIPYPISEALIGHHSKKLTELFEEHQLAVHNLETTLAAYLSDGKHEKKSRPTVRLGGFLCCGGRKVDAIEHYTQQVADLDKEIKQLRKSKTTKTAHYGWISFDSVHVAHATERALAKKFDIRLSPTPTDLVWSNLPLDHKTRQAKRWTGRIIYWVFVFAWMIPMTALSATSNIINLIRLIPNSASFIDSHQVLMGVIQAYFTPIVMAVFFYLLPLFFRFLSQQQGYWTQTTLDRKVLTKLYVFFIINNLLVFTLTSMFIGIYGQIRALVESGSLPASESIAEYVMQIAKNIAEVSTFWINFVCLKSLTLTMDLAMLVPLLTITIRKFITRPSPRELRELAKPPEFNYPQNYNLLLFFFTIALVYSAMSPLILPFALIYFAVASMVYKYMLMYVYVTKMESGGKIWPVLFQTVMTSVIFFQLTMIIMMALKGGSLQAYCLIPLPILTLVYQYFYYRRMHVLGTYLSGSEPSYVLKDDESAISTTSDKKKKKQTLHSQFQDPAYHHKLSAPTVHDDVKHLLQKVYKAPEKPINSTIEMAQQVGKTVMQDIDLDTNKGFHHHHHKRMTIYDQGCPVQFETVQEDEILDQDSSSDEEDEDEKQQQPQEIFVDHTDDKLSRYTTYTSSFGGNQSEEAPLLSDPPPVPPFHMLMPRRLQNERNVTSEYIEMYSSFTPNASQAQLAYPQDEKTDVEEEQKKGMSLDEFGVLGQEEQDVTDAASAAGTTNTTQPITRRHTAPIQPLLIDVDNHGISTHEPMARHHSLPVEFYQARLSHHFDVDTSDEEDDEEEVVPQVAVELRRQLSVPVTRTRQDASMQRSRTMPSRRHQQQQQHQQQVAPNHSNPFEDTYTTASPDNEEQTFF
ncbi:conserved hypothetical protein [Mucor ambiguus]|uniref:DUF221-domain-containing protein n=1 Tax=Mucor ambiguus TaxID=91626 RepID=A0A0C9MJ92_9FUNG|nr:conserved hypothetical protein [Mucor ambiguus]